MSLQKRLSAIEARIRQLETWKAGVEQALAEEDEQEETPSVTLDGETAYGERNQDEPL